MDHGARSRIAEWKAYQASWQQPIDQMECDAERFYHLRRNVLNLNRLQCARLLRVHRHSVLFWENGTHPVPFYAYLALRLIAESLHYKFADAAWQDWQLVGRYNADQRASKAEQGYVTELVNRKLGACFTPRDLENYAFAMSRVAALQSENATLRAQVETLTRENTEIRELFRVGGVTAEVRDMRERLEGLLGRINTAEIKPPAEVRSGAEGIAARSDP